jgi:hypothetical protein
VSSWDGGGAWSSAEGVHVVPPNENFFGVDFADGTLQGASASQFTNVVGDVVLATEVPGKLFDITWNGTSFQSYDLLSADVGQWEGTTFAPAGIAPIPPVCPVNLHPVFLGFSVLSGATLEDPNTLINGNIHSNNMINFSSKSVVHGDASAVKGFTGKGYTITTGTPFGPVVTLPTLSAVLLAVPPTKPTIVGNVSINKANAAAYDNGVFSVKGNVSIGDVTLHSTFIATGTIGMSAGARLTAFAGGLAAYGDRHVMASGVINGAVISPDVDLATATKVCP